MAGYLCIGNSSHTSHMTTKCGVGKRRRNGRERERGGGCGVAVQGDRRNNIFPSCNSTSLILVDCRRQAMANSREDQRTRRRQRRKKKNRNNSQLKHFYFYLPTRFFSLRSSSSLPFFLACACVQYLFTFYRCGVSSRRHLLLTFLHLISRVLSLIFKETKKNV